MQSKEYQTQFQTVTPGIEKQKIAIAELHKQFILLQQDAELDKEMNQSEVEKLKTEIQGLKELNKTLEESSKTLEESSKTASNAYVKIKEDMVLMSRSKKHTLDKLTTESKEIFRNLEEAKDEIGELKTQNTKLQEINNKSAALLTDFTMTTQVLNMQNEKLQKELQESTQKNMDLNVQLEKKMLG